MEQANRMVGALAIGAAMLIGLFAQSAQAGYIVDLSQVGSNVIASGNGAIDLTGLSFVHSFAKLAAIHPSIALIYMGEAFPDITGVDEYCHSIGFTGPTSFGSGGESMPSSGRGGIVGIQNGINQDALFVPMGYVSGDPLGDVSTYKNQTFSSLCVTSGRYEWTWGTGPNQNFTLVIETARAIPEPLNVGHDAAWFRGTGLGWISKRLAAPPDRVQRLVYGARERGSGRLRHSLVDRLGIARDLGSLGLPSGALGPISWHPRVFGREHTGYAWLAVA
jgi:hypothetical protein